MKHLLDAKPGWHKDWMRSKDGAREEDEGEWAKNGKKVFPLNNC